MQRVRGRYGYISCIGSTRLATGKSSGAALVCSNSPDVGYMIQSGWALPCQVVRGGLEKSSPPEFWMAWGMGDGSRNSLRVSVWGGALRFSSVLVGTHCQVPWAHFAFLLRFRWWGYIGVGSSYQNLLHFGRKIGRTQKFSELACLAGKMFVHSLRVVCTP